MLHYGTALSNVCLFLIKIMHIDILARMYIILFINLCLQLLYVNYYRFNKFKVGNTKLCDEQRSASRSRKEKHLYRISSYLCIAVYLLFHFRCSRLDAIERRSCFVDAFCSLSQILRAEIHPLLLLSCSSNLH